MQWQADESVLQVMYARGNEMKRHNSDCEMQSATKYQEKGSKIRMQFEETVRF